MRTARLLPGKLRLGLAERLEDIGHLSFHGWGFTGRLLARSRRLRLLWLYFQFRLWLTQCTGSGSPGGGFRSGC